MREKIKKFKEKHAMVIDTCICVASNLMVAVSIGFIGYMAGEGIATLKIGKGLCKMNESEIITVFDPAVKDPIWDLKEYHALVKCAKDLK